MLKRISNVLPGLERLYKHVLKGKERAIEDRFAETMLTNDEKMELALALKV
jgi:hypothetical protein